MTKRVGITATGQYFPPNVITNDDLAEHMDTSDEWIRTRTGISQRHHADPGVGSSDLAVPAIGEMLERRGLTIDDVDLLIVATTTADTVFPSTACRIQHKLGAKNLWGFDLSGACSGFLYALITGHSMVASGQARRCIVVGTEVMSSILNRADRKTFVLFGDGAGCVLLEEVVCGGILDSVAHIDGAGGIHLHMPAGGSKLPASSETVANGQHYVHQNGKEVFKSAVRDMVEVSLDILNRNNLSADDIDLFIPHQANIRIIESASKRLRLPSSKVMINIDSHANTTAATLPTCMDEAVQTSRLKKGNLLLLTTFGAGYTWGSALLEWSY